jgi:uncharacterized protein (UPF0332 family)
MAHDWCDFLKLAETLAKGSTPAEHRSAISRAYYSTFHVFLDFVKAKDKSFRYGPGSPEVHARLWDWFKKRERVHAVVSRVAMQGKASRDKRNNADYDDGFVGDLAREARFAVERAQNLNKLVDDPNLNRVAP